MTSKIRDRFKMMPNLFLKVFPPCHVSFFFLFDPAWKLFPRLARLINLSGRGPALGS